MISEIRKAYYDKLQTDLPEPVWSRVPDEERPPFVIVGQISLSDSGLKSGELLEARVSIMAVVEARSPQPCEDLVDRVIDSLRGQQLAVPPIQSSPARLVSATVSERGDGDGKLWVGDVSFSATVR